MDDLAEPLYDNGRAARMREINNMSARAIAKIMGSFMDESLPLRLRCECGRLGCEVVINITLAQRHETRADYPLGFIVIREHIYDENGDKVLLSGANYVVVAKG